MPSGRALAAPTGGAVRMVRASRPRAAAGPLRLGGSLRARRGRVRVTRPGRRRPSRLAGLPMGRQGALLPFGRFASPWASSTAAQRKRPRRGGVGRARAPQCRVATEGNSALPRAAQNQAAGGSRRSRAEERAEAAALERARSAAACGAARRRSAQVRAGGCAPGPTSLSKYYHMLRHWDQKGRGRHSWEKAGELPR